MGVLVQPEIGQGAEGLGAHVAPVLRELVAARVLEKVLELREHGAAAVLDALVHLEGHVREDEVALEGLVRVEDLPAELAVVGALDAAVYRRLCATFSPVLIDVLLISDKGYAITDGKGFYTSF